MGNPPPGRKRCGIIKIRGRKGKSNGGDSVRNHKENRHPFGRIKGMEERAEPDQLE
ncbi:hypothetical protein CULT_2690006 [[Clostridium] ultunense Esp]|nr:hypothetical protein CULT_2690006 [[Clostridium] ultunense Esp]